MITKEQAQILCDAHDVYAMLASDEEIEILEVNNPVLLEAYLALRQIAEAK